MSAGYRVLYTDDALDDLREIASYIANELSSPMTARDVISRIRAAATSLSTMPGRHALVEWEPWYSQGVRSMVVGSHRIFYVVDDGERKVTIVRVLYARMDFGEHASATRE